MEILTSYSLIIIATLYKSFSAATTPCVDSCVGLEDGNYQHCQDCHHYVACNNTYKVVWSCPQNLLWDDVLKSCEYTSSTCESTTTYNIASTVQPTIGCGTDISARKRVTRGPTWNDGDGDGGAGKLGTVILHAYRNFWEVRWDAGKSDIYRMGEGFQDLCVL